jgi:hypothetical protein
MLAPDALAAFRDAAQAQMRREVRCRHRWLELGFGDAGVLSAQSDAPALAIQYLPWEGFSRRRCPCCGEEARTWECGRREVLHCAACGYGRERQSSEESTDES